MSLTMKRNASAIVATTVLMMGIAVLSSQASIPSNQQPTITSTPAISQADLEVAKIIDTTKIQNDSDVVNMINWQETNNAKGTRRKR